MKFVRYIELSVKARHRERDRPTDRRGAILFVPVHVHDDLELLQVRILFIGRWQAYQKSKPIERYGGKDMITSAIHRCDKRQKNYNKR